MADVHAKPILLDWTLVDAISNFTSCQYCATPRESKTIAEAQPLAHSKQAAINFHAHRHVWSQTRVRWTTKQEWQEGAIHSKAQLEVI